MKIKSAIGIRRTTVELTDDVTTVDFGHDYKYFAIRNDGSGSIYVSTANKECTAGEDEVVLVPSGSSYVHYNGYGGNTGIYISGTGTATVVAQDDGNNPFKGAQGGGESVTVDVLNAALEEKADSKHSHTVEEISDFPTSMPASDVMDWAKANEKPTYTASEVGADVSGSADAALTNAKSYTDTKIADLINGAPTTLDTLGEIAEAMGNNQSVVEALNSAIGSKANTTDLTSHTDNKSNPHGVTKSQVGLGNVPNVATNDQTPSYAEATSLAKLSSGEKLSVAFGKISKAITDFISHIGDTVKHITSTERTNWNAAKSHADSAHAPSNAQANVIETIKVNGTALTPSSKAVDITVPSYSTMTGATSSAAGTSGLVPAPAAGKQASFLRGDGTWAVPTNTDTKVTNTLNTTAKAYVTGTTSSSTNTGTQVFDTGVYLDTTAGMLTATTFKGALSGNASTSTKLASSSCTTISIATSDWSTNSDGGYICTKTLSSAMAYTNFNFDVVLSTDQAAAKLQIEAWNCVIADGNITQTTSNGSTTAFTFYAFTTKPSVALTIAVQGVS